MLAAVLALALAGVQAQAPPAFAVGELAAYRLTPPVFARFEEASRLIAEATRDEPRYVVSPLFTREIALSDDVVAAASELQRRLRDDPELVAALARAGLAPREFTLFAINLVAARLVHGFLESGAMRRVPPGVTADNVAFVGARLADVSAVLARLGLTDLK